MLGSLMHWMQNTSMNTGHRKILLYAPLYLHENGRITRLTC